MFFLQMFQGVFLVEEMPSRPDLVNNFDPDFFIRDGNSF
jgi:hypothetical protein